MVTFSDCMNLLLTFFVLLVTFSCFSDDRRQAILVFGAAIRATFGAISEQTPKTGGGQDHSSVLPQHQIQLQAQPEYGSDKPAQTAASLRETGVLLDNLSAADYDRHKLFRIASRKVFLGKGTALSAEGRYLLSVLAAFLKDRSGQVVVCENGPDPETQDRGQPRPPASGLRPARSDLGLARAWAVLEFLVQEQKLDPRRFGISTDTTMPWEEDQSPTRRDRAGDRRLEILLLEGSVAR